MSSDIHAAISSSSKPTSYLLIGAEFIHAVLDVVGKFLHIALVLWNGEQVDKDFGFAFDDYIRRLRAFGDYPNAHVLPQWNQAPTMRGGEDEIVLIALHTVEFLRRLRHMLHRSVYSPSRLIKSNSIGHDNMCSSFMYNSMS